MKELAELTPAQLIDMSEELRLAKATMDDVRQLYDVTKFAYETCEDDDKRAQLLHACISVGGMLREVSDEIGAVTGKAAGAMAAARHFIGVQNIGSLIAQITYIVGDEVDDPDTVRRIAQRLNEVQISDGSAPQGTAITPDMEAQMMDDTVPRIAHDSEAA